MNYSPAAPVVKRKEDYLSCSLGQACLPAGSEENSD